MTPKTSFRLSGSEQSPACLEIQQGLQEHSRTPFSGGTKNQAKEKDEVVEKEEEN